jgi:hypothetical protein
MTTLCESLCQLWNVSRFLDVEDLGFSRPCGSCQSQRFGGTQRLHHQGFCACQCKRADGM